MSERNRCLWLPGVVALALALVCSTPASAVIIPLAASIDEAQANAGAGSGGTGTGTATVTLDDVTNLLSWNISWSGLTGTETLMHFHGPALPNQNAGVQVDFGAISGIVSPSIGNAVIDDLQEADLLAGLWYVNIHTTAFAGGEIRGNLAVIPEPSTSTLLISGALGLLAYAWRRRRRRT